MALLDFYCYTGFFFFNCGEGRLLSRCGMQASHCSGFSCFRSQALGFVGFGSCGSWALEQRLNSCDTWAWLPRGMWDFSGSDRTCLLPQQVDSLPLNHQGSPGWSIILEKAHDNLLSLQQFCSYLYLERIWDSDCRIRYKALWAKNLAPP